MDPSRLTQFTASSGPEFPAAGTQLLCSLPDSQKLARLSRKSSNTIAGEVPDTTNFSIVSDVAFGNDTQASLARMPTPDIDTGQLVELDTVKINQLGAAHSPSSRLGLGNPSMLENHTAHEQSDANLTSTSFHDTTADHHSYPPASAGQVQASTATSGAQLQPVHLCFPVNCCPAIQQSCLCGASCGPGHMARVIILHSVSDASAS